MSEAPWQSRAHLSPLLRPEVMVGAASPLWGYFTGFAMAGVGWWWATRWVQPAGFELLVERAIEPVLATAAELVAVPAAEPVAAEAAPAAAPIGGESAPVGVVALVAEPELAAELAAEPEVVAEAVVAEAALAEAALAEAEAEVVAAPVAAAQPEPATEPEAATKPVFAVEPEARPARARKAREAEPKPH